MSASSGNFRGSREMACERSELVLPRNGRRPKMSSQAQTPRDHQSIVNVYPFLFSTSGAACDKVRLGLPIRKERGGEGEGGLTHIRHTASDTAK